MGLDHAVGALMGAAVGDAVGAYLEFREVEELDIDTAMTLPGGGVWRVGPGQFTDDTELALCQAHGLVGNRPSHGFPAEPVARQYAWWYHESDPFDVGAATRAAFRLPNSFHAMPEGTFAATVQSNVRCSMSQSSKANGATMRATPLAIWSHQLGTDAIAAAAKQDAQLSHPNQTCQDANAAYVVAVAHLIRQPGNAEGALLAAEQWAAAQACPEVQGWLQEAGDDAAMAGYDASQLMGFVKHAILLTFYHLRRRSSFEEGLRHALAAGGDTDTNAAIVCGMLGALHGASGIPEHLRSQVASYAWKIGMQLGCSVVRPKQLRGCNIEPLAARLYEDAVQDAAQAAD